MYPVSEYDHDDEATKSDGGKPHERKDAPGQRNAKVSFQDFDLEEVDEVEKGSKVLDMSQGTSIAE